MSKIKTPKKKKTDQSLKINAKFNDVIKLAVKTNLKPKKINKN